MSLDFGDPLEVIREAIAIANAYDVNATNMYINIEIKDNVAKIFCYQIYR